LVVRRTSRVAAWVVACGIAWFGGSSLLAQEQESKPKSDGESSSSREPEDITLKTEDGVKLAVSFFPGTKGRESIPVILLHGLNRSRQDYVKDGGLAPYLQEKLGCAVVVPDLRGHGESKTQKLVIHNREKQVELKVKDFRVADYEAMVEQDLRAVKDFLWKKNNKEQLNLDKLVVVGTEMGGALALNFALYDSNGYENKQPFYGSLKLGRFLKGAVLISPDLTFRGVSVPTAHAMASPYLKVALPVMIVAGTKNRARNIDAEKLNTLFTNARPDEKKPEVQGNKEKQTLWYRPLDTSVSGNDLLGEESLNVPKSVGQFIYYRLVKNVEDKDCKWQERKYPHE
jgi:pimeloyl-ACP methyl ester carboxylesterase